MKLSICIPTRNRPDWCIRALRSVAGQLSKNLHSDRIQILISDNSDANTSELPVSDFLNASEIPALVQYWRNRPPTGMVENWNLLADRADGDFLLWLHDDDYLLPGALDEILSALDQTKSDFHCFSAQVFDDHGKQKRRGGKHRTATLSVREAVRGLLTHSSWIRFPCAVVRKRTFLEVGAFNPAEGDTADLDCWLRLAARTGLQTYSQTTAGYTVHTGQATNRMFSQNTLEKIHGYGCRCVKSGLLLSTELDHCQRIFFWRFVLAGTLRSILRNDLDEAGRIMNLANLPPVQMHSCPLKWKPLYGLFQIRLKFNHV